MTTSPDSSDSAQPPVQDQPNPALPVQAALPVQEPVPQAAFPGAEFPQEQSQAQSLMAQASEAYASYPQAPYGQGQYPQAQYAQAPYAQDQYTQGQYGQGQYPQAPVYAEPYNPGGQAYGQPMGALPFAPPAALVPPTVFAQPTPPTRRAKASVGSMIAIAAIAALLASLATGLVFHTGNHLASARGTGPAATLPGVTLPDIPPDVPGLGDGDGFAGPNWRAIAAAVSPSVVAIEVSSMDSWGEGSGFVLTEDGLVLTNEHVVVGATDDTVLVTLYDGRVVEASIVGMDFTTDLAVVQMINPPDNLQPISWGDSDSVRVGDPVMAVGNPLGLANTVTTGTVSAVNRPVTIEDPSVDVLPVISNAIQIDASVNPGNSGGPVFNMFGQVIGITSAGVMIDEGGSIGLGFAIPSNVGRNISAQLIAYQEVEHAFLGVVVQYATATADGVTRRGASIVSIEPGSPAEEAGLVPQDVVVGLNGRPVTGADSLTAFVRSKSSGDTVLLTVIRDGQMFDVEVTLATRQ